MTMQRKLAHGKEWKRLYIALYLCMAMLTLFFLLFCAKSENRVFRTRETTGYHIQETLQSNVKAAPETPAGIQKEYILKPELTAGSENSLIFYQVHHSVELYLEGELVFSLMPEAEGLSGGTVGCSWIVFPLRAVDAGSEIRVSLTPLYSEVKDRVPEFFVGSSHEVFRKQIGEDFPDFILGSLSVIVGIVFACISLVTMVVYRRTNSLMYLGCSSAFMGLWKLTDIRSATILFPQNPALTSALSLIMLPMAATSFAFFIQEEIGHGRYRFLNSVCVISACVTIGQLLMQAAGIRSLRENLILSHGVIFLTALAVGWIVILETVRFKPSRKLFVTCLCYILCIVATVADILYFYLSGSSNNIASTLMIFLVYIVTMGILSVTELNQEANTDFCTGLFNRSRCNELILDKTPVSEQTCFMMFDLNGLKRINDTRGHEVGDRLISGFAKVFRQSMPSQAFLGRYGGDEFIAVLRKCDEDMAGKILADIASEVEKHNAVNVDLPISYSVGYAISDAYPECTMLMLLEEADYQMYRDKKAYYEHCRKEAWMRTE